MNTATRFREWSGKPLLAPFSWDAGQSVILVTDLFAVVKDDLSLYDTFAVMALCPQHRFRLRTAFPDRYHDYVRTITEDDSERLHWLLCVSFVLNDLGRYLEAQKAIAPAWPLKNVELASLN